VRVPLTRETCVPLYRQITEFLRSQIQSGVLPAETRLPASRDLAQSLGVNRITVTEAYAELEAEGLVYSRRGSGTFVSPLLASLRRAMADHPYMDGWPAWQYEAAKLTRPTTLRKFDGLLAASALHPNLIDFANGRGASELFPMDDFRKAFQAVFRRDGVEAMAYGDPAGYPPLRETIAHILSSEGIPARGNQVLITTGSQQAMALVARVLLRPGDTALVESPTYIGAIDIFRSAGAELVGVPVDEQGMEVERLEEIVCAAKPRLLYTIPTFHNPTGTCMSGRRRRELVALADRHNMPIVEDDFVGDLRYDGHTQPALKALDTCGNVIHICTFSKVVMPGLRVGYLVAAGPVYEQLLAAKELIDVTTPNVIQRALEAFITVGRYQTHVRRACQLYRRRRDTMVAALARYMPAGARWVLPHGGLFMWLQLPGGVTAEELYPAAVEEHVIFVPGSMFFPAQEAQPYVRLNFAMHSPHVIEEGIRRLGRAIEQFQAGDTSSHCWRLSGHGNSMAGQCPA